MARRTKSTESAPAISYRMDPPVFHSEEEEEGDQVTPTRDSRNGAIASVVLDYRIERRMSAASTASTASSTTETSEETDLSGETLFSPPTSPVKLLSKLLRMDSHEVLQQVAAGAEPVRAVGTAQRRRRENNPLSYVDALRAKIELGEDSGVFDGKSRGLWDYWRGRD